MKIMELDKTMSELNKNDLKKHIIKHGDLILHNMLGNASTREVDLLFDVFIDYARTVWNEASMIASCDTCKYKSKEHDKCCNNCKHNGNQFIYPSACTGCGSDKEYSNHVYSTN